MAHFSPIVRVLTCPYHALARRHVCRPVRGPLTVRAFAALSLVLQFWFEHNNSFALSLLFSQFHSHAIAQPSPPFSIRRLHTRPPIATPPAFHSLRCWVPSARRRWPPARVSFDTPRGQPRALSVCIARLASHCGRTCALSSLTRSTSCYPLRS